MKIQDILNENLSDSLKIAMINILLNNKSDADILFLKEGGSIKVLHPTETITIGSKEYDVEIADTLDKRKDGLSRVKELDDDEGMLFIHEYVTSGYYTMKDTDIDLDIVFIDEEGVVIKVASVEAHDPNPIRCANYKYVLEVSIDSDIEIGDELDQENLDYSDEDKQTLSKSKMLVLDSNGDVQMKLEGGERIISMIKTRQLIKAALKAYKTDNDVDYTRVGRMVFKELDAQDSREPLYVSKAKEGFQFEEADFPYQSSHKSAEDMYKNNTELVLLEVVNLNKLQTKPKASEEKTDPKSDVPWNVKRQLELGLIGHQNEKKIKYNYDGYGQLDTKMLKLVDLFEEEGLPIYITSGFREAGEAGKAGSKSWHTKGLAIDIIPLQGHTFDDIARTMAQSKRIRDYMAANKFGYIDETSDEMLKKTGGTGKHFHIGPDLIALLGWANLLQKYPAVEEASSDWRLFRDRTVDYFVSKGMDRDAAMWRAALLGFETGHGTKTVGNYNYGNIVANKNWNGAKVYNKDRYYRSYATEGEGLDNYLSVLLNDFKIDNSITGDLFLSALQGSNPEKRRYAEANGYQDKVRQVYNMYMRS